MTLDTDEQLQRALELAYAYLNRRDRTISEVRLALQRKGISESLTEAAIRTLTEQRLLDDNRFAELYVSDKRELEQWGSARIRRGLLARGIDRELADAALAGPAADDGLAGSAADDGLAGSAADDGPAGSAADDGPAGSAADDGPAGSAADDGRAGSAAGDGAQESELDRARALLRRRFSVPPATRRDRERALGLLLRKGYEPELALDALAGCARDD